jgi:dsRNA-specific ribonuclease
MTMPEYTAQLWEWCTKEDFKPVYNDKQTRGYPSRYEFSVTVGDVKVTGKERSSKKEAKHEASKVMWEKLRELGTFS